MFMPVPSVFLSQSWIDKIPLGKWLLLQNVLLNSICNITNSKTKLLESRSWYSFAKIIDSSCTLKDYILGSTPKSVLRLTI